MSDRLQSCPGCGCVLSNCPECGHALANERSQADFKRLFALIDRAFEQWPENAEFQPRDSRHLRAYLLVRAGHFNVTPVHVPEDYANNPASKAIFRLGVEFTARAQSGESGYHVIRISADAIEVITARSIARQTIKGQKEFNAVREPVEALIEHVIGVPANQLLRERAA